MAAQHQEPETRVLHPPWEKPRICLRLIQFPFLQEEELGNFRRPLPCSVSVFQKVPCPESNLLDTVVFISGFVPNEKLPCILSKSSMVVFPSLFPESFGLVNVEAMFMRLPIIAFGVGGTQDFLLDKRNGEIIADRTAKGLALKMHKMVTNPQLRNQYGANGEELARAKYDSRKLLSRVVSMYEHMCLKFNCF